MEQTNVSFVTLDGATRGTVSVPTGSPADEVFALKTHLQSYFGWGSYDTVIDMQAPGKYVIVDYPLDEYDEDSCQTVG
jgi:hypothetical protein